MINKILQLLENFSLKINIFLLKITSVFSFILKGLRIHNKAICVFLYRSLFIGATILFLIGMIGLIACLLMADEFVNRKLTDYTVPNSIKIFDYFFKNSHTYAKDYMDFINSHAFLEKFPLFGIEISKRFLLIGLVAHIFMMLYQISKEYLKIINDRALKTFFYFCVYFSLSFYIYINEYEIYTLLANFVDLFSFKYPKPIVSILENYYLSYVDYYHSQGSEANIFLHYDWFFSRYNVNTKNMERIFLLDAKRSIMDAYFIHRKYPPTIDKLHEDMVFKQEFVLDQFLEIDYLLTVKKYHEREALEILELNLSENYKKLSELYPDFFFGEVIKQPSMLTRFGITLSYNRAMDNVLFLHKLLADFELEGQHTIIERLKKEIFNTRMHNFGSSHVEKMRKLDYLCSRSKEMISDEKLKFIIQFINDISVLQRANKLPLFLDELNENSSKSLEQLIKIINKRSSKIEETLPILIETSTNSVSYNDFQSTLIHAAIMRLINGRLDNVVVIFNDFELNITKEFALSVYNNRMAIGIESTSADVEIVNNLTEIEVVHKNSSKSRVINNDEFIRLFEELQKCNEDDPCCACNCRYNHSYLDKVYQEESTRFKNSR